MSETTQFEGWAVLELMGHRKLAGYVRPVEMAGAPFFRLDVPAPAESADALLATQFYAPGAVYCLTPCTEETARAVALGARPAPVQRWELPAPTAPAGRDERDVGGGRDVDEDEDEF